MNKITNYGPLMDKSLFVDGLFTVLLEKKRPSTNKQLTIDGPSTNKLLTIDGPSTNKLLAIDGPSTNKLYHIYILNVVYDIQLSNLINSFKHQLLILLRGILTTLHIL